MDDFDYDMFDDSDDLYDGETSNLWYKEEEEESAVSATELLNLCLIPSITDGIVHSANLLLWCFLFRITTQIAEIPATLYHAISAATGLLILHHFFQSMSYYILIFGVATYFILFIVSHILNKWRGIIISIVCISTLILCEMFIVKKTDWHKIRGAQMLVAMKAISVGFDVDIGTLQSLPSAVEYAGYIFSVGTCVFGPWVPYREYVAIYKKPIWNLQWIWRVLISLGLSLVFLTISTCWIHWLIPDDSWRWWLAYRDALSFRSSHYFISFLSEASAVMAGYGVQENLSWSYPVSRPQFIEIPRSLVQVVVSWNMPMHYFLKHYVFRTTKPLGSFASIIATYIVSSLLHGINFQLAAVLLSLGVYTYIEYVTRQKLSSVFSACILVRPCRRECNHNNKEKKFLVLFANVGFGILSFFHLSYLGVMFDSADTQEEGYNYKHALIKWSALSYASHWLALFTFLFYLLI